MSRAQRAEARPADPTAALRFGTKAETLARLKDVVKSAHVLPQILFTVEQWRASRDTLWEKIQTMGWETTALIVRSSALNEDREGSSNAGRYRSVPNVRGREQIAQAIESVIASYADGRPDHQIFLQPMLAKVKAVVGCEEDIGAVGEVFGRQCVLDVGEELVDGFH